MLGSGSVMPGEVRGDEGPVGVSEHLAQCFPLAPCGSGQADTCDGRISLGSWVEPSCTRIASRTLEVKARVDLTGHPVQSLSNVFQH